jgi:hypothetical protein
VSKPLYQRATEWGEAAAAAASFIVDGDFAAGACERVLMDSFTFAA